MSTTYGRVLRLIALLFSFVLVAAACGAAGNAMVHGKATGECRSAD